MRRISNSGGYQFYFFHRNFFCDRATEFVDKVGFYAANCVTKINRYKNRIKFSYRGGARTRTAAHFVRTSLVYLRNPRPFFVIFGNFRGKIERIIHFFVVGFRVMTCTKSTNNEMYKNFLSS